MERETKGTLIANDSSDDTVTGKTVKESTESIDIEGVREKATNEGSISTDLPITSDSNTASTLRTPGLSPEAAAEEQISENLNMIDSNTESATSANPEGEATEEAEAAASETARSNRSNKSNKSNKSNNSNKSNKSNKSNTSTDIQDSLALASAAPLLLTPKPLERKPIKSATTQELRVELGSDGITEALLGSLSSRSTASARGRRARPRLGPIKQGTKSYLARSIVPILIEGLTQLSIVRPKPTLSTMGPHVWLANFLIERSSQRDDYEVKRLNVGLNVKTQTMYDDEYPPIAKKCDNSTQTRLGGREAQLSIGDGTHGMAGGGRQSSPTNINNSSYDSGGGTELSEQSNTPSLIEQIHELASLLSLGLLTMEEFAEAKKIIFKKQERINATPRHVPQPPRQQHYHQPQQQHQQHQQNQQNQQQQQPPPQFSPEDETFMRPPSSPNSSVVLYGEQNEYDQMFDTLESGTESSMPKKEQWDLLQQQQRQQGKETEESVNTIEENVPPSPDQESNEVRAVFMALDHRGTGAISTLDMLHTLPNVVTSPIYKKVSKKKAQLHRLSRPNSFRNEMNKMMLNSVDGTIDIHAFTSWMENNDDDDANSKKKNKSEEKEETAKENATVSRDKLDLRRPHKKRVNSAYNLSNKFQTDGLDLRRPSQKRKENSEKDLVSIVTTTDAGTTVDGAKESIDAATVEAAPVTMTTTTTTTTTMTTTKPNTTLMNVPGTSLQNKRLHQRIKNRTKNYKILKKLYHAMDISDKGQIKKMDIFNGLSICNDEVDSLLSYHEELIYLTRHQDAWKMLLYNMNNDNSINAFETSDGNSTLNEDDFCRFATAIMNVERNNKEDSTQEDNEIRSKYNDSLNMEQNQWNISQHIYDLLNVDESISKETFLSSIQSNNSIQNILSTNDHMNVLQYETKYSHVLLKYKTLQEKTMTLMELSIFIASLTIDTNNEEGVSFGEKSVKFIDDDDY